MADSEVQADSGAATPAAADAASADAASAAAAAAGGGGDGGGDGGDNKENNQGGGSRGKKGGGRDSDRSRDETPIEELYDLSQPIPHVSRPSKEKHEAEVAELNAAIDALKEERTKLQAKIDGSMTSGKNSAAEAQKKALQTLRAKKGALIDEKKLIRARLDAIRSAADKLQNERKSARASVKFSSVPDIEAEIARLYKKQETTSMSLSDEKRLIKEIDSLEASKKMVAEIKSKDDALGDVKDQRKVIGAAIAEKDQEIDAVQKEIDEGSAKLAHLYDKESGNREQVQKLFKQRDELRKQISDKIDERNGLRAAFREENNKWYNCQRAIRKQKQMKYDEEKKAREAEREAWLKKKEEEELKKIPYEEEMALCDYLAEYLSRTYLADAEAERKKKEEELAKKKAADVVAVKDDPFANFKPVGKKKGGEEEVFLQIGAGKKKKRQRNKAKAPASFTLSVDSFEQFGLLGLTPPTSLEAVQKSVDELRARKKWYSEQPRGSVKTAQEIRKENEKNAAKIQQSSSAVVGEADGGSRGKEGKAFDATREDFAPLGSGEALSSINSTWGQKSASDVAGAVED